MFLCTVARPHFNPSAILGGMGSWGFGLLGIGNLQNGDKKGPKGTLVWKNRMVTKELYRDPLISKLIPAILEKWPRRDRMSRTIYMQQDSTKNHIYEDDKEFNNALMEQDIDAKLYMQTLNSPDISLLDLGFFRAIQSFNDASLKNEEELIQLAMEAYDNYP